MDLRDGMLGMEEFGLGFRLEFRHKSTLVLCLLPSIHGLRHSSSGLVQFWAMLDRSFVRAG